MTTRPGLPPDPRTIAEMIPVRQAEIKARPVPRCPTKGHGLMVPCDPGKQTYEVMYCGVWYECSDPGGCNANIHYLSRELAAYHGEPYVVDASHWEAWNGSEWEPITREQFDAYWAVRLADQKRIQRAQAESARVQRATRRRRVPAR